MNGLRRLGLGVFALCGLAVFGFLGLSVYGSTSLAVLALLDEGWCLAVLAACSGVCVLGFLVCLGRALFVRKVRAVEVVSLEGGQISVTKDAIAAQARHIVEADGTCRAARVSVEAKARGNVRVAVRVAPRGAVDVVAKGAELHAELLDGLALVCGDTVRNVRLEFVEPDAGAAVPAADSADETAPAAGAAAGRQRVSAGAAGEIRVAVPAQSGIEGGE